MSHRCPLPDLASVRPGQVFACDCGDRYRAVHWKGDPMPGANRWTMADIKGEWWRRLFRRWSMT